MDCWMKAVLKSNEITLSSDFEYCRANCGRYGGNACNYSNVGSAFEIDYGKYGGINRHNCYTEKK
jgi:hypothetical protein